ncbi:transposase [Spirosoma jeollabukense]
MESHFQSPKTLREKAVLLLKEGQKASQIATDLNLPIGKVYYWQRYYLNPSRPPSDGRRLYDDQFKRDVLNKIADGVTISKLSRSLGVSKVTLFKWKREGQPEQTEAKEEVAIALPIEREEDKIPNQKDWRFLQDQVDNLLDRIRVLEEEKDTLTKALRIVIGAV